ncbi:DksA/TraR family C4-type zinc finger protein [Entomomonas sp. E2T0]|uniref:DksA/TraR family C4-type zinc finger protein n=1 Tax=Entomomonas sp. E2T0 TaxID=2930213 RepID=UPI002228509F|nr:DksA/TraR family C4-type zinc finger protein [Entomomonas sp. E2T0]UYZ83157.1 DksA/TraR family C4-type zinc finger protein [Entomomonas sp. E2T0]
MASGWASDDAVSEQIESSIADAVEHAKQQLNLNPNQQSSEFCEECGEPISEARRKALLGVRYCINCQQEFDKQQAKELNLYNRRGSKDSQLR